MSTTLTTHSLPDLITRLTEDQARKVDVVLGQGNIRFQNAHLLLSGVEPILDDRGVTDPNGAYPLTDIAVAQFAERHNVPTVYARRLVAARPDLWDATFNGLLHGAKPLVRTTDDGPVILRPGADPDDRRSMLRLYVETEHTPAEVRGVVSDRFLRLDHTDVLLSVLRGAKESGADLRVERASITDRSMYVYLTTDVTSENAAVLLGENYMFGQRSVKDYPLVQVGLVIVNSELGFGSAKVIPHLVFQVCTNGMTMAKEGSTKRHIGAAMSDGVQYADDTLESSLTTLALQTRDTVRTFLTPEWTAQTVEALAVKAGRPIPRGEEEKAVQALSKESALSLTDAEKAEILRHFLRGGVETFGGLVSALTAHAQDVDPDRRFAMESAAALVLA